MTDRAYFQVHVDNLSESDLLYILTACYPELPKEVLEKMVLFNQKVCTSCAILGTRFGLLFK